MSEHTVTAHHGVTCARLFHTVGHAGPTFRSLNAVDILPDGEALPLLPWSHRIRFVQVATASGIMIYFDAALNGAGA